MSSTPPRRRARAAARDTSGQAAPPPAAATPGAVEPSSEAFTAAILRFLRRTPNATVTPNGIDLRPLADELGVEPVEVQLALERLADRGLVTLPFIEPSRAGGAELTESGLRWLIRYEGGRPKDVPVAYQPASAPVRTPDEAARLPRVEVYGTRG